MARTRLLFCSLLILGAASGAMARTAPHRLAPATEIVRGGPADPAKMMTDSVMVLGPWGSGATYNGEFETPGGGGAWNGWAGADLTLPGVNFWHADTYHAVSGAYSAWCGSSDFPACDAGDEAGGYGNSWDSSLDWHGAVPDPSSPCTVTIAANLNHDLEQEFDLFRVQVLTAGGTSVLLQEFTGSGTGVPLNVMYTYDPGDYVGGGFGDIWVRFEVLTDNAYSDEDCMNPSIGAVQLDDISIALSQGGGVSWDFEDGTLGPLVRAGTLGVGDFARIWTRLGNVDPCTSNTSPQVAFIDTGNEVAGTGGSPCQDYCYGPGGYTVNHTGGREGPGFYLMNAVESPVMAWPTGYEGGLYTFTVYEDDYLFENADDPGIVYSWEVRSTADPDPAGIESSDWLSDDRYYFNETIGGRFVRREHPIGRSLVPGATFVQVRFTVREAGHEFTPNIGSNATPAPYFDNARLVAARERGPDLTVDVRNLARDVFPAGGLVDMADPGALSARFDGRFDSGWNGGTGTFRDAVEVHLSPGRSGAVMNDLPQIHYRLIPNPIFDPYRTSGLPLAGAVDGWLSDVGAPMFSFGDYSFDLPDSNFLFPGDQLRYFFTATDELGGVPRTTIVPADTSGFSDPGSAAYDDRFTVRVLPTISEVGGSPGVYSQPDLLLWHETTMDGNLALWRGSLAQLGMYEGVDYDICAHPGDGGNLSDRVSLPQLGSYTDVIGSFENIIFGLNSEDVLLLDGWLALGGRDFLFLGERSAEMVDATFRLDRLGVASVVPDVAPLIGGQDFPTVVPLAGDPVFSAYGQPWLDNGRCGPGHTRYRDFFTPTAITAAPNAVVLAEYSDPSGATGVYQYAAALLNISAADNARVVTMPTSLRRISTAPTGTKATAPLAARVQVLGSVLAYFGNAGGEASAVPGAVGFSVAASPNPFNPSTKIAYSLPRAGRLLLKVFDLQGRLVRTLVDDARPAGPGQVVWNGADQRGAPVSSGVYFYLARSGDQQRVGKLALIK